MKIAVNTRLLVPNKMDGIARFSYETLQIISRENPHVQFVFIFDRAVKDDNFDFPDNVSFVSIPPPARHPVLWYLWFEQSLKRYLNNNKFDLFLSPEGWIPGGLKCKSLGVIHDLNFEHHPENIIYSHRKYLKYFFPKFAKRATRIATVSEYSKKDIVATYNIEPSLIDVVYNGANDVFAPISSQQEQSIKDEYTNGKDFFIFIGTLHPRKNLIHLFLGFDRFKKEHPNDLKLLVVGNRKWWPKELEQTFQALAAKEDVIFPGRMEDNELANTLSAATALTYLPYFEGFGIPILEAFQAHTAVITSNVTSMPEVANGAAILCDPRNIEEIAKAMHEVNANTHKREEMIQRGTLRAKDFSWQRSADLLWESITKTIS